MHRCPSPHAHSRALEPHPPVPDRRSTTVPMRTEGCPAGHESPAHRAPTAAARGLVTPLRPTIASARRRLAGSSDGHAPWLLPGLGDRRARGLLARARRPGLLLLLAVMLPCLAVTAQPGSGADSDDTGTHSGVEVPLDVTGTDEEDTGAALPTLPAGAGSDRAATVTPATPVPPASTGAAAAVATAAVFPPRDSQASFVAAMAAKRREDPHYLALRYQRARACINNKDLWREQDVTAFLMTPREKFCRPWNLKRAYEHAYLDIKYGVTISGPHVVSRMTSAIEVKPGEKVLEIGTGSGYQAAVLSYLTDQVYTIEIIEPLASETDQIYTQLAANGYPEYANIRRKADDGYYGWEEHAPFDKIVVTCGIDHLPPPLLKQLKVGGTMVIPVGAPGAQVLLKVCKRLDEDGEVEITREDIYKGRKKVPFVPFTKKGGGDHNARGAPVPTP